MRKYLYALLAATALCLGFTACGDEEDKPEPTPMPVVITFDDYSTSVGMTLQAMMNKFGEPTMNFSNYYMYTFESGKVASLTFILNPETNTVYGIMQTLAENAYKPDDIKDYFAAKLHVYAPETETYVDEETGETITSTTYLYGNAEKEDDATLLVEYDGALSVGYYNPKNEPAEVEPVGGFEDATPEGIVGSFLGENINDILEEYGEALTQSGAMYMAFMDENELLMGFALNTENDIVTSIVLLYAEELSDEDIIAYYKNLGYTCTDTGEVDEEEGTPIYQFVNAEEGVAIVYTASRGMALPI
ncbi:MAG: hypothetical protein ILA06_00455 [Bacteroidaceae bacterium]|nr:hypothetical protein [Bacteroidaceae bacterium]